MDSTLVKLIDSSTVAIQFLVTKVQAIAPEVWAMTRQKVYADSMAVIIWVSLLFVFNLFILLYASSWMRGDKWKKVCEIGMESIPCIFMLVFGVTLIVCFVGGGWEIIVAIKKLIALDYYTVQELIHLVK